MTARKLARLLDAAERHDLVPETLWLSTRSPEGKRLISQLKYVQRRGNRALGWGELADVLRQVDELAAQLEYWTHPRLMLDTPVADLLLLQAGADVQAKSKDTPDRERMELVAERLARAVASERKASGS